MYVVLCSRSSNCSGTNKFSVNFFLVFVCVFGYLFTYIVQSTTSAAMLSAVKLKCIYAVKLTDLPIVHKFSFILNIFVSFLVCVMCAVQTSIVNETNSVGGLSGTESVLFLFFLFSIYFYMIH